MFELFIISKLNEISIYIYHFAFINIILLLSIEFKKSYLNEIKNKQKLFL